MTREELNKILEEHKKWLDTDGKEGKRADLRYANLRGDDLRSADLCGADLCGADLCGANLDYSCFPLWCGGLDVHIDDRQATQLLYHLARNVLFSKNTSNELKALFSDEKIIEQANKFHRVNECGKIKRRKSNANQS